MRRLFWSVVTIALGGLYAVACVLVFFNLV